MSPKRNNEGSNALVGDDWEWRTVVGGSIRNTQDREQAHLKTSEQRAQHPILARSIHTWLYVLHQPPISIARISIG